MNRKAWQRAKARFKNNNLPPAPSSLNTYLTTILAAATIVIAYAQYRVSVKQTEISNSLAELEFTKTEPDFDVKPSRQRANLRPALGHFENLPPMEVKVTLANGTLRGWSVSGRVTLFFSNPDGFERCALRIHGVYKQSTRGDLEFIATEPIQKLADSASAAGMKVEGFITDFFVVYRGFVKTVDVTNISIDGSEYSDDGFVDVPIAYNGSYSGGAGFYFDETQRPSAEYCPVLRTKILKLIDGSGGKFGDRYMNVSPAERNAMGMP